MSKFNFGVEVDIDDASFEKAVKASDKDRYKNMWVQGLASDDSLDEEGQVLLPSGYDFSYFLKSGKINLEHYTTRKGSSKYWIGEPTEAYVKGEKFFIKAKLWEHQPEAREFYDTIVNMKKSGSTRRPGFSIEGRAIEKDPFNKNRIIKAKILNCAVTLDPVNQNSFLDIVKGTQKQDFIESTPFESQTQSYLLQYELEDGSVLTVNKDMSISINRNKQIIKTVDVASMRALMPESIDGKEKNLEKAKILINAINKNNIEKSLGEKIIRNFLLS